MALFDKSKSVFQIKYFAVPFAGILLALMVGEILTLQLRYLLAITGGIVVLSIGMVLVKHIEDYLVYLLILNIPFTHFDKLFFANSLVAPANGLTIGIAELLIFMTCIVWFSQVFIARKTPFPKLQKTDYLILVLIITQVISMFIAPSKSQAIFIIIYTIKHALICFFIAHKIKRCHLKWVILIFLVVILGESTIGGYERITGNVGIARSKGKLQSSDFAEQYTVPGLEQIRAEGTTVDSHELGLYYTMLLPIPFVLMLMRFLKPVYRFLLSGVFIIGVGGDVITFSRSGWLSLTIASTYALGVLFFSWKQRNAVIIVILLFLFASFLYPQAYEYFYDRLFNSPAGLLEARWEMNKTAMDIWSKHFFFGYGAGNYQDALKDPHIEGRIVAGEKIDALPVHNAFLYISAEQGLFGVIAFYGIIITAICHCYRMLKCRDTLIRGLALAILAGLLGYILDGVTNPLYRHAVVYAQLWVYIGISMSFNRLLEEQGSVASQIVS
ncbi:MAG: O-antigen ligase family protein [Planctomycetota bacterium]|jgi:hypothetical protein